MDSQTSSPLLRMASNAALSSVSTSNCRTATPPLNGGLLELGLDLHRYVCALHCYSSLPAPASIAANVSNVMVTNCSPGMAVPRRFQTTTP